MVPIDETDQNDCTGCKRKLSYINKMFWVWTVDETQNSWFLLPKFAFCPETGDVRQLKNIQILNYKENLQNFVLSNDKFQLFK